MMVRTQELLLSLSVLNNFINDATKRKESLIRQGELDKAANVENRIKGWEDTRARKKAEYVAYISSQANATLS